MDYVLDANIIMSMLISGKASYRLLVSSYRFHLPGYALLELEEYHEVIHAKSKLKGDAFTEFTLDLFRHIRVIPHFVVDDKFHRKAQALTDGVDEKDSEYVALALALNLTLLTRDEPLLTGLQKRGFRKVMRFSDFLKRI